jgi:hypothetical protein
MRGVTQRSWVGFILVPRGSIPPLRGAGSMDGAAKSAALTTIQPSPQRRLGCFASVGVAQD